MNFCDLKKTLTTRDYYDSGLGITILESNKFICIYQVSGEHLQDHWSTGLSALRTDRHKILDKFDIGLVRTGVMKLEYLRV